MIGLILLANYNVVNTEFLRLLQALIERFYRYENLPFVDRRYVTFAKRFGRKNFMSCLVAEHLVSLTIKMLWLTENEQTLVHSVQKFDVLAVREVKANVEI